MRLTRKSIPALAVVLLVPSTALGRDKDPQLDKMMNRGQELMMVLHDVRHNQLPLRKAQRDAFNKELKSWAKELERSPTTGKGHNVSWLKSAVTEAAAELGRHKGKHTPWKGTMRAARKISRALSDVKHSVPGETAYEKEERDAMSKGTGSHSSWSHASRGLYEASSAANKEAPRLLKSRLLGAGSIARGSVIVEKLDFGRRGKGRTLIETGSRVQIQWKGGKPIPVLRQTDYYGNIGNVFTPKYINTEAEPRKPVTVPLDGRGDQMLRKAGIRMSVGDLSTALQKEQRLQTGARRILGRHQPAALTLPQGPSRRIGQGARQWLGRMRTRVKGLFPKRRGR